MRATDRGGGSVSPVAPLTILLLAAGITLTVLGHWAGSASSPGAAGAPAPIDALGREVAVGGLVFRIGDLVGLAFTVAALVMLAVPDRRARGRPVAPTMGFGQFRPDREPGGPGRAPGASVGEDLAELGPLLDYLRRHARVMGLRSAACLVAPLVILERTSAADPARYLGQVWASGYPYVLAGAVLLLLAAGACAVRGSLASRWHARLAVAIASRLDRDAIEMEVAEVEDRLVRRPRGRAWPLVVAASVLYGVAALGPFAPALAGPWAPWSDLAGPPSPIPGR